MSKKTGLMAVAAVAAMLAGCVSTGVQVDTHKLEAFKVGETTEAEARAALGPPTSVSTYSGGRILSYVGIHAQAHAINFVPIVGAFAGGADSSMTSVTLTFGPDGKLKDMQSSQSATGANTGLAAGHGPDVKP